MKPSEAAKFDKEQKEKLLKKNKKKKVTPTKTSEKKVTSINSTLDKEDQSDEE